MVLIYLLFFVALNFLIFTFFTKKILHKKSINYGLISILILILLFHFSGLINTISNDHLFHLIVYSLIVFVFYYGIEFLIWFIRKVNKNPKSEILIKAFNFFRFYFVYIFVLAYQFVSLLSIDAREHFKAIESIF